ncbi:MAG TPA: malto-oligosyltrehalose trehalohydrolase [Steroidobacteraceae bacterium]|jgi:malto-oligosyltrehalose trehalohydrolase|nr:malto-oligosyltrehalose trehalohydrolase [Steroidobacteraceae bacterium]
MTRRRHEMPFGAQILADGHVRFRLWAPAATRVELVLESESAAAPSIAPLRPACASASTPGSGWFEVISGEARAGSRYRYRIDGEALVPDPASRRNSRGVHGPSEVVDAEAFDWTDADWRAPPWRESVVYELHVGTFTPEGSFAGVASRLEHLQRLGVTAIELMPVAQFPGSRGWGYDGVLPYAPASAYGSPEDLKSLVCAAHAHGIAVMLDVVYNHFGPEGNFLHLYAPQFFTGRHSTPWGAAMDFEAPGSRAVRDFFIHNALYWLEEYHLDGLRLDAVHAIFDAGEPHILTEIARAARDGPGRERPVYLVLENLNNEARRLGPGGAPEAFDAQWNDDSHHCLHVLLTGETDSYYADYREHPHTLLCRSLAEGFAYQGESSRHLGVPRGERSGHLPPSAFVNFLQNHDQVGNRARGERLAQLARPEAVRAAAAVVLLAPSPPMLFMGEEWAAPEPFPYFCDFEPELAAKVRAGRLREFVHFQGTVPDPCDAATCASAHLEWSRLTEPVHARMFDHYRRLLAIRRRDIVPLLPRILGGVCAAFDPGGAFAVDWRLRDGGVLHLLANLKDTSAPIVGRPAGRMIFATHPGIRAALARNELAPWSVTWLLEQ